MSLAVISLAPSDITLTHHFGVATYPPGASFGPRRMADWEFVWLLEGSTEYR